MALHRANEIAFAFANRCESPIEELFAVGLCMLLERCRVAWRIVDASQIGTGNLPGIYTDEVLIAPQCRIAAYRVDFLLRVFGSTAVVECDGQDFHYSNRSQIERDRNRDAELDASGHKVFRFPGKQIYAGPAACAEDVFLWLIADSKRAVR